MAHITLNSGKLKENYLHLDLTFRENNIRWSVVSKLLSGNIPYLKELLALKPAQICDSRISNLRIIKSIDPAIETMYIKPPPRHSVGEVVKFADISLNTEIGTIRRLSAEAKKQGKIHKVIIMIEMGELREGVMREDFMDFFSSVAGLPDIDVVGIGTNMTCLYGVLPNEDKLIQLALFEQLISARFGRKIRFVSGGSSVTLPLMQQGVLPGAINHFRVGETLFLGTNVYDGSVYNDMHNDVFRLYAEIIELTEKPSVPQGEMGMNVEGEVFEFDEEEIGRKSWRAIVDMGLLDVDDKHIVPADENLTLVGASSDMFVLDLGEKGKAYKVGDYVEFKMDYIGVVRILNSKYIEKRIVT